MSNTVHASTGAADVEELFGTSALASRDGAWARATSHGCDPGDGRSGGAGNGAVPTRIDAGAGGAAATSGAPAAAAVLTALAGAGLGALRRRRR